MSYRQEEQPIPRIVKRLCRDPDEDFDSSDDEGHEYSITDEQVQSWCCKDCGTYISKPCHVDEKNNHFQYNPLKNEYVPVSIDYNGKQARLIIHTDLGVEYFFYVIV
jgi:hypothetical protein